MDHFMAAWAALDAMALSLKDPQYQQLALDNNRNVLAWYVQAFEEVKQVQAQKVSNGKPKAQPAQP